MFYLIVYTYLSTVLSYTWFSKSMWCYILGAGPSWQISRFVLCHQFRVNKNSTLLL